MAVMPKEATVKLRLDTAEFFEAVDQLPDEVLDRLADKLAARIEWKLRDRARLRGDR